MKRLSVLVAGTFALGASVLLVGGGPVQADAPSQAGWWTATNAGAGFGIPSPPPPPDVPPNGLLVEGGQRSPTAYAAVVYDVPQGAVVGKLTMTVATEGGQPDATPATNLQVCPLQSAAISPEQGGPMSDAPAYSTGHCLTGGASSSGGSYSFNVSALVTDGALAVAILPTTPTDRVVFAPPGADSLQIQQTAGSGSGSSGALGSSTDSNASTGSAGDVPSGATGSPVAPGAGGGAVSVGSSPAVTAAGTSTASPPSGTAPALAAPPLSGGTGAQPSSPSVPNAAPATRQASAGSYNPSEFAYASLSPPPAKAWAVGALVAAVLAGVIIWTAAGRAAARAALRDPEMPG